MEVKASLRYLRMSPRKVRLVIDAVRGLSAAAAEDRLRFIKKGAVEPVLKLLRSAIANAEHNNKLRKDDLVIKSITADGGPTIKRQAARAFGRGAPIRKRTTHINLVLGLKAGVAAPAKMETSEAPKAPAKKATATKSADAKAAPKKRVTKKSSSNA